MLNQLFQRPYTIRRHLDAPLLKERLHYLTYHAEQETARIKLREISSYQLTIIKYLHLKNNDQIITLKKIEIAANRWAHHQKQRFKGASYSSCKGRFIKHSKHWLQFVGRFKIPEPYTPSQVIEFANYMRKEQNLSEVTIYTQCKRLRKFFSQIKEEPRQFLAHLTPARLDAIQIQKLKQGVYSRYTIRNCATTLRAFLRYAECQGWCRARIADSIQTPRVYKHATLPSSPTWEDVQRLLKTTEGNSPSDIRARAIILLLAVYGLRSSEVCRLRLEDFDWEQETFRIKRSKLGPTQQFPLVQTVGQALIRYLKEVRPQRSTYREIFLTLCKPFHPMNSLYNTVALRWAPLNVDIKHHGAHSLRHACATRLINQGMPLKTIADQLGHRNLETTRIYAKVDLPRLREVANFNLRGVL
jgi:site-specific recombinase XerD